MDFIHVRFYAPSLGMQREMNVLLPGRLGEDPRYPDGHIPVLYLLHGWSGGYSDWLRRIAIERYAEEKGIAVVMPGTDLSFYADMYYGYDFYRFMTGDLPARVAEFFPALSTAREDTFVGGLSMGGFGALKLGIDHPERFAAVIGLSSCVDTASMYPKDGSEPSGEVINAFGPRSHNERSVDDLPYRLEQRLAEGVALPRFFLSCGQQDFLYADNLAMRDRFAGRLDLTWHEEPGDHTWDYWDRNIARAIDWLPLAPLQKED